MTRKSEEDSVKGNVIKRLLDDEYFLVHVNPSASDLVLPEHLLGRDTVTLKLSRLFRGGIELKSDKIITTLLFDERYVDCSIPLEAIWGVTGHDGSNIIWPESTPKNVLKGLMQSPEEPPPAKGAAGKRPGLKRVK